MPHDTEAATGAQETRQLVEDASRDLLAALVRSSADAMVIETLDGTVTYWNPAAEQLYGYAAEEVIGRPLDMLIPPDQMSQASELIHKAHRGEHVTNVEAERWTKDGRRIDVSLSISPVRNEAGEIISTSAIVRDITERKATEQALAASEALLEVAFENATIGMIMLSPDDQTLRVNHALCQMLGYLVDELRAISFWTLTHPDDVEAARACVARALAGDLATWELEERYIHRDGHIVWGKLNGTLARDANGSPQYFILQIQDITSRKETEEAFAKLLGELQESEARYRTLIEQLPGAVYLLADDANQTPLYFSPQIEQVTGETPEEAMALHRIWLDLVHPDDRARVAAADERQGEETLLFREEYRHRHMDGGYVWVRDECVPVFNDAGQIVAWQGMMVDITDRVQATQALAQLAALVESAEDAIISGHIEGTIISWNPGAEHLYGYTAEEMIGQSFLRLLPEGPIDPVYEQVLDEVKAGHTTPPYEGMRRRKDGTLFAASVSLSPMRDPTGAISGVASIIRDITGRKRAEAALQQALAEAEAANAAKSQFLAMMSHELRTPLQAVLGYAEFLLSDPESLSPEQREDIGYIQQGGQRMLALINQLLDLSRIEAGRLILVTRPVDLEEVLEQVRQDVAPMAMQKGLDLCIEAPAVRTVVIGDPERMRQILLNLVSNAVKFTEQGSVHVTVESGADGVAVRVQDTGIGIAAEDLPHIFEAFRQVDTRLSRRHGGAGLGIAIAQKLAELMGGTITVESEVGKGSTFTLSLPTAPPAPASPEPPAAIID
jgi:PAS domain S-box-containing protein